jgi:hypothetical protein
MRRHVRSWRKLTRIRGASVYEHFIVEVTFDHRCRYVAALSTPAATSIQNDSGQPQGPVGASAAG